MESNNGKIPSIGFGTSTGTVNPEELERAIDTAIAVGYRHIDTAFIYGTEKVIGQTLQKWFKSGKLKREEIFITTKLPVMGTHPDRVDSFIQRSLSNLQLDYVDLYLVHFPVGAKSGSNHLPLRDAQGHLFLEPKTDHAAIWKKMEAQLDAGRTRSIGLSNYNISQIQTVLKSARFAPSCLQVELHAYLQQRELVHFCHQNGITVVAFSPLGAPDHNKRMKGYFAQYEERPLPDILGNAVIGRIGEKHGKSAAQVALRFLVQLGVVPIPKSMNPGRIKENFDVFDFELDGEDMERMAELEMGERARVSDFLNIFKGVEHHPDYPFGKL